MSISWFIENQCEAFLGEAGRSSVIQRSLMVVWVAGWIPSGGPVEIFLVKTRVHRLVWQRPWNSAYTKYIAANRHRTNPSGGSWFPPSLSEWSSTIMSDAI